MGQHKHNPNCKLAREGKRMKSVLISIKPEWCEKIASGEKTVEIRKTKPKIDTPFKVYIYCTQEKRLLHKFNKGERIDDEHFFEEDVFVRQNTWIMGHLNPNGKVIGEFVCARIDEIGYSPEMHGKYISEINDLHKVSCVDFEQMFDYIADGYGYGWHISNLKIYNTPKELSEFVGLRKTKFGYEPVGVKPPRSWCYVEEHNVEE